MARKKTTRRSTGSLFLRGGVWYLRYELPADENGKRIRKTESMKTDDKTEAEKKAAKKLRPLTAKDEEQKLQELVNAHQAAHIKAEQILAKANRIPLADVWGKFESDQTRPQSGPHTLKGYKLFWTRFVEWCNSEHKKLKFIEEVEEDHANAFMLYCKDVLNLGPNRYNKTRQALNLIFQTIRKDTPFAKIRTKKIDPVSRRELTADELRAIMTNATGELRLVLAFGYFCGFRLADACGLLWKEVDFEAGNIIRIPSKTKSRTGKAVVVAIHPVLAELLQATPESKRKGQVCPEFKAMYDLDDGAKVAKIIRAHFVACGIEDAKVRDPVKGGAKIKKGERLRAAPVATFHSLRHTFVSVLNRENVPISVTRKLVGHTSESVTRVYIHTNEEEVTAAVATLPNPMAEITVTATPLNEADQLRRDIAARLATATQDQLNTILELLK